MHGSPGIYRGVFNKSAAGDRGTGIDVVKAIELERQNEEDVTIKE